MNFIDLKTQYKAYQTEIQVALDEVIQNTAFVKGPAVKALAEELADHTGVKHALPCGNGTDALIVALKCLGIGPGDEVIVPGFSFFATAGMVSFVGATPVFVDVDDRTCNIDVAQIKTAITGKTKAIMPVSLYGQVADMKEINELAAEHNLPVIEDAAQSYGAIYRGYGDERKSCALSKVACTSFYPAKALGGYGEGGAVFTDDDELAEKMGWFIDQGQSAGYVHEIIGFNSRLDTLQAAVLRVKLKHYDQEIKVRKKAAELYLHELSNIASDVSEDQRVVLPKMASNSDTVWSQFTIKVKNRDQVRSQLKELGIPTAVHYPKPMNKQPAYVKMGLADLDLPISNALSEEVLSLPMHGFISLEDVREVAAGIKKVI